MNIEEVKKFHAYAMALDGRIQQMDSRGVMAHAWHLILEDVPYVETDVILKHLYARPQMLVLQPGHVADAWAEVRAEREEVLARLASAERYLAQFGDEDPPDIRAGKVAQRDRLLAALPPHVREARGRSLMPAQRPQAPRGRPTGPEPSYWTPSKF